MWLGTAAYADVPLGTYTLEVRTGAVVYSDGKKLPPCGEAATEFFQSWTSVPVVYTGNVRVGLEDWKLDGATAEAVWAYRPMSPKNVRIHVSFWRDDIAKGYLSYMKVDARGHEICGDARGLAGTYTP